MSILEEVSAAHGKLWQTEWLIYLGDISSDYGLVVRTVMTIDGNIGTKGPRLVPRSSINVKKYNGLAKLKPEPKRTSECS